MLRPRYIGGMAPHGAEFLKTVLTATVAVCMPKLVTRYQFQGGTLFIFNRL